MESIAAGAKGLGDEIVRGVRVVRVPPDAATPQDTEPGRAGSPCKSCTASVDFAGTPRLRRVSAISGPTMYPSSETPME